MKFLIIALCVCAVNTAAVYKPWQKSPTYYNQPEVVSAFSSVKSIPVKPFYKPEVPVVVTVKPEVASAPVVVVAKTAAGNYYEDSQVPIVQYENNYNPETQSYSYAYKTGNGIYAESSGNLKRVGDSDVLAVQGAYEYTSPEGVPVVFTYVADENGYQPKSDLLPVGPAVPEAIVRSLNYIASHPPSEYKEKKF